MADVYTNRPVYSNGVKITDWDQCRQSYPYDFKPSYKQAHYRTFGNGDRFHTLETTTHEALERGISTKFSNPQNIHGPRRTQRRPITNFTSFPSLDNPRRFDVMENAKSCYDSQPNQSKEQVHKTTYSRSYIDHRPRPIKDPEVIPDIDELYPLFNRISKNDSEMISPLAPNKFMDDHLTNPTPQKKLSNFYKRIRMVTYNPWLGTFT